MDIYFYICNIYVNNFHVELFHEKIQSKDTETPILFPKSYQLVIIIYF